MEAEAERQAAFDQKVKEKRAHRKSSVETGRAVVESMVV